MANPSQPASHPAIQPDVLSHHHSNDLSFWGRVEHVGLCEFRTRLVSFCHTLCVQNVKIHFTRIYGHWPPPTPRHHHIFIYTICTIYACGICACLWLFLGIYTLITHTHTCSGRNENIMLHFIRGALIHIPTSLNALQPLKID